MNKFRVLPVCLLLALALAPIRQLDAFLAVGPLRVTIDVIVNTEDGLAHKVCGTSSDVKVNEKNTLWLEINRPSGEQKDSVEITGDTVSCGSGIRGTTDSVPGGLTAQSYLSGDINVTAIVFRQMEDERVLTIRIKGLLKAYFGTEADESSTAVNEALTREFSFADNGVVFIPILLDSEASKHIGLNAAFLRVEVRKIETESESIYGTILVFADDVNGEVFLDGGSVGEVEESERGNLTLKNVKTGMRGVSLRESSGKQQRKVVRVEPDRTVLVGFNRRSEDKESDRFVVKSIGVNEQGFQEYRRHSDDAMMVKIPAGEFKMGNRNTERTPFEHMVYLSEYLMDKTEVTWGQYKKFAADTGIPLPPHDPYWGIIDNHPMAYVTWEEARAYCHWTGGRLPTEAEREKAARGTDGRMYPWGDEEPTPELGVFRRGWGGPATDPVGSHPKGASPYGLLDMGGNQWEWCLDWYSDEYLESSPYENPQGPAMGTKHVLRGGSWDSRPDVLSASCRNWGHRGYREGDFGFRCAMNTVK
jgi:formylglycine-generating enzyme required for sulfatase activity